jgi:outer membrane receptor for Fe3+-dicitrate
LSDDFDYKENIYAGYLSYQIDFEKWNLTGGLRGEYTFIDAISRSLGKLETQKYFELFPTASIHYQLTESSGLGLSYKRAIQRPRYQSLNPFKYFITENNYNAGNPNLVPAIENKITLSYDYKNKLFFELYYQYFKNSLSILTFQDNQNRVLRNIDSNLISDFQYSFDIVFVDSIKPWWFLQLVTSTFYLENEFYSVESIEETYSNDTNFGCLFMIMLRTQARRFMYCLWY